MVTTSHALGFNEYPEEVENLLSAHDWEDPKLNRLRMGTVLTLAVEIPRGGGSFEFIVDSLDAGGNVILRYPGARNNGFDYRVRVEGWQNKGAPMPSHAEVYSEYYHKREHDSQESFDAFCEAAEELLEGKGAQAVLDEFQSKFNFSVGRVPEAIIRALPWLFIEQDIRYWYGDGRERTIGAIRELRKGKPIEEFEFYEEGDLQSLDEIHQMPLAIPNQ